MTTNTEDMSSQSSLLGQQLQEVFSSFDDLHMVRQSPLVYQELLEALECFFSGMPASCLPLLELEYGCMFDKSLDYESLGVKDTEELVVNMFKKGMVLYFERRVDKEKYIISARMVEIRRKVYLKHKVEKLLNRHGGEIALESFEDLHKDQFKVPMVYDFYALTDLDHLCQVLKDILVVEVANPSGVKVIKAVEVANPSGAKVIKAAEVANPSGAKVAAVNLRKRKK